MNHQSQRTARQRLQVYLQPSGTGYAALAAAALISLSLAGAAADPGAHGGIGCAERRPEGTRLSLRRLDDHLRPHAGDRVREHCKGDERILGDSDFVESVLAIQREHLERRYAFQAQGFDFKSVVTRVGDILGLEPETITAPSKQRRRADARALVCYFATRKLGMAAISVARLMGVTHPAVTRASYRGETLAKERNLQLAAPPDLASLSLRP